VPAAPRGGQADQHPATVTPRRIVRALLKLGEHHARREGTDLIFATAPRQRDIAALAGTTGPPPRGWSASSPSRGS
jgi:hypothetical protein